MASIGMDGMVSAPEGARMRADMIRRQSMTMEYFLESRKLDQATADMLLKYDADGNGVFSKDEVAAIIIDLRDAMHHNEELSYYNTLFKRLLIAAVLFAIFLLSGMFCLSYVVAVLTANTKVESTGVMMTKDGINTIATDSIATIVDVGNHHNGNFCVPKSQAELMINRVSEGRNVLLKLGDSETGNTTVSHLRPAGMQVHEDGRVCFWNPENTKYECLVPTTDGCTATDSQGRRLESNGRRFSNGRRLTHQGHGYSDLTQTLVNDNCKNISVWIDGVFYADTSGDDWQPTRLQYCNSACGCSNNVCTCSAGGFNGTKCAEYIGNFECPNNGNYYHCDASGCK